MKKNNNIVNWMQFIKGKLIKFFKILTKHLFALVICLFALYGFISMFVRSDFSSIDSCLDLGGVWDYEFETCRFDCETWTEKTGCVLITDEKLESYVNGYCSGYWGSLYRCDQARLELSKRKLRDEMLAKKDKN